MTETIAQGTWVEISAILLAPGQRAPQVPDDTRRVPLEMRVKGFLLDAAGLGDEAEIRTPAGRRLRGTLRAVNPGYDHGFGPPVAALSGIADAARAMLQPGYAGP
jgi:hypothetical protein